MGYLEGNKSFKLHYRSGGRGGLDAHCDSDWGNSSCRRPTTGIMTRYNRGMIMDIPAEDSRCLNRRG